MIMMFVLLCIAVLVLLIDALLRARYGRCQEQISSPRIGTQFCKFKAGHNGRHRSEQGMIW